MPVFDIKVRRQCRETEKKQLIEDLCEITNQMFAIPPDKIAVLIQEIPNTNWGQAGTVATNPHYEALSRRTK